MCRPYLFYPASSFGFLALTAVLAIFPHRRNNSFRKLITFLMFSTWIVLTTALAVNVATLNPWLWGTVTGVVMLVFGQMWELEKYRVSVGPLQLMKAPDEEE